MKKALFVGIVSLGVLFGIPGVSHAERITNFSSTITISNDSSIQVNESISYDFEGESKHGIYREIPLRNNDGSTLSIDSVMVTTQGVVVPYSVEEDDSIIKIKIGDPNKLVSGIHEYSINYKVVNALVSFDAYDELYWNVTGNGWNVPIDIVSVKLHSNSIKTLQSSCYTGVFGSTEQCSDTLPVEMIGYQKNLSPREGVTVAAAFEKGKISGITRIGGRVNNDPVNNPRDDKDTARMILYIFGGIVFLVTILIKFLTRDKKSSRALMAQYEPPYGLSPIQAGVVIDKGLDFRDITAQIISLAERGYIKIAYLEKKILKVFNATDYEFTLIKSVDELGNTDKKILEFIFGTNLAAGTMTTLTEMSERSRFISQKLFRDIQKAEEESFITQGFFKKNNIRYIIAVLFIGLIAGTFFTETTWLPFLIFVALIGIIASTMHPRILTDQGAEVKQELLGFKEFLSMTDKDRFDFHNAPEKKPEQFMEYLPYAIAFRIEEKWSKQFDGMMVPAPSWYQGGTAQSFSAYTFTNHMTSLGSSLSTFASAASSGSGGSGSSGGGSGGGGGGSW